MIHNHMKNTIHGIWQEMDLTQYINQEIIYYVNDIFYCCRCFIVFLYMMYRLYISILFDLLFCFNKQRLTIHKLYK